MDGVFSKSEELFHCFMFCRMIRLFGKPAVLIPNSKYMHKDCLEVLSDLKDKGYGVYYYNQKDQEIYSKYYKTPIIPITSIGPDVIITKYKITFNAVIHGTDIGVKYLLRNKSGDIEGIEITDSFESILSYNLR